MNVVHRNAFLLAAGLVFQSGMIQLAVALGTVTLVTVTGIQGILGAGPAVFLIAGAVAVGPAGRLSDRIGRMPVIRSGFVLGMIGPAVTAGGCAVRSGALVVAGLGLCGAAQSIVLLSRAAAAEMFPPERRARGMSIVLFGVVSGAIWGPLVFGPMFANRALTAHELVVPWLAAGAFPLVGLAISAGVRPDPKTLGYHDPDLDRLPAAPLKVILRRPGVATAMVGAVGSFSVMVGVMNLAGYIAVGHGHAHGDVFTIISLHIVGMYGLILIVGELVERIGRSRSIVVGLARDGGLERRARLARLDRGHEPVALRPRTRLVPQLRRVHDRARRTGVALRAGRSGRVHRPPLEPGRRRARPRRRSRLHRGRRLRPACARRDRSLDPRSRLGGRESAPRLGNACARRELTAATISPRRTPGVPPFLRMKTYNAKPGEIQRDWVIVDADGKTLGRLATHIADRLRGKGKPTYTPHVDTGDFVVVVNAEKIAVTGKKLDQKMYYRHSGYPGGLRERTLREQLNRQPTEVLRKAVKGMLPRNKLGRAQLTKLKIYAGPEHPHEAQAPTPLEV